MKNSFDTIVIGVGGMGSATCYELAKRGQNVLGLEQFDIPHNHGSSHGSTRIIRKAYFEGSAYVPLLHRAYDLWEDLESISGKKLHYHTGSLDIGLETSSVYSGSVKSCKVHNLDHEILTAAEVNKRYPGYHIPDHFMANYSPDGGFLTPEKCIVAFVEEAQKRGAVIRAREEVLNWEVKGNIVNVKTSKNEYFSDKVVFTSGAWNSELLPILHGLTVPERQVLIWLQPDNTDLFAKENFPVFILEDEGQEIYGFPIHEVPGFKFGKFGHLQERGSVSSIKREPDFADEVELRKFSRKFFPKGNGPTMSMKTCMFTNTPDSHFILDQHPEFPQVVIGAGFSGHGFKFASVIGEIMADLVEKKASNFDINMFRIERLV